MAEVTLESLAARVAELERKLAAKPEPQTDWRSVVGLTTDVEFMERVNAAGRAYRDSLVLEEEAEADVAGRGGSR